MGFDVVLQFLWKPSPGWWPFAVAHKPALSRVRTSRPGLLLGSHCSAVCLSVPEPASSCPSFKVLVSGRTRYPCWFLLLGCFWPFAFVHKFKISLFNGFWKSEKSHWFCWLVGENYHFLFTFVYLFWSFIFKRCFLLECISQHLKFIHGYIFYKWYSLTFNCIV